MISAVLLHWSDGLGPSTRQFNKTPHVLLPRIGSGISRHNPSHPSAAWNVPGFSGQQRPPPQLHAPPEIKTDYSGLPTKKEEIMIMLEEEKGTPTGPETHDQLAFDPANANKGTERGRALVESSLAECGAGRSILADANGTVIAGNKTLKAARKLGMPLRVIETEGAELIVVKRNDMRLDRDPQARRLAYLDNRTSELGLEWDLSQMQRDIESDFDFHNCGFEDDDLAALLRQLEAEEGLVDPDEVPDVPEEPVTRQGDLWIMGPHRLKCGDATSPIDVEDLLQDARPFVMVTDPPYGVNYDPAWRNEAGLASTKRTGKVANDDRADWTEAYKLFPGDVAYVWHAGRLAGEVAANLAEAGFGIRAQIIWRKPHFAISRGDYHWQHEPCWYAVRSGCKSKWNGDRSQSTVWDIDRKEDSEQTVHATQKPVEAMRRPIRNHGGPDDAVYDPFLGSGTALIACEMLGRACLGLELDPRFCDVIVRRWENFTGQKAEVSNAATAPNSRP